MTDFLNAPTVPHNVEPLAAEPGSVVWKRRLKAGVGYSLREWWSVLLVGVILVPVTFWPSYKNGPPIRSDGLGYHAWVRAILQRDLRVFCRWPALDDSLAITWRDRARGTCLNKFPPGVALLQFPVMAPLVDLRPNAPLITPAEHKATLILGAIALLLICIVSLSTARRLGAPSCSSHLTVLTIVFGTGLFHYATYDSSFSHIYSALGFALLIWLGIRSRQHHGRLPGLAVALTAFFLMLIRATNVLGLVLLAGAYWFFNRDSGVRTVCRDISKAAIGAALAQLLEAGYASYITRTFAFSGYANEHFLFNRPMQLSVLASYERGLFTYYPVVAVALFAGLLSWRTRTATVWVFALIAEYVLLYGYWDNWMLGGGFGHRGFVEIMPFVIPPFAIALSSLGRVARGILIGGALASSIVTIELMIGYWYSTLPFGGTTRTVYWANVLGQYSLIHKLFR